MWYFLLPNDSSEIGPFKLVCTSSNHFFVLVNTMWGNAFRNCFPKANPSQNFFRCETTSNPFTIPCESSSELPKFKFPSHKCHFQYSSGLKVVKYMAWLLWMLKRNMRLFVISTFATIGNQILYPYGVIPQMDVKIFLQ